MIDKIRKYLLYKLKRNTWYKVEGLVKKQQVDIFVQGVKRVIDENDLPEDVEIYFSNDYKKLKVRDDSHVSFTDRELLTEYLKQKQDYGTK